MKAYESKSVKRFTWAAIACAVTLLSACAGNPPTEQMAVAESAVKRATTSATSESAPAELQRATDKLANARQALAAKDYPRARQLAEEAEVDAQAAEVHAQSVRAGKAAQDSQDAARALREELARKTPR